MFLTKLKLTAAALATAGAIIAGAGVRAYQETSPRREPPAPPAAAIAASDDEEADDDSFDRYVDQVENLLEAARNAHSNNDQRGLARALKKLRDVTSAWDDVVSGDQAKAGARPRPNPTTSAPFPTPSPAARPRRPANAQPENAPVTPVPPLPPTPPAAAAPPGAGAPPAPPAGLAPVGAPRAAHGPAGGVPVYGGMMGMPAPVYGSPAESERRLQEVERKLDRILRMLEGPGQGQNAPLPAGGRAGGRSNSPDTSSRTLLPFNAPPGQQASNAPPGQQASNRAPRGSKPGQPGAQGQPRPVRSRAGATLPDTSSPDQLPPDGADDESVPNLPEPPR
jgi:hypothetical protein